IQGPRKARSGRHVSELRRSAKGLARQGAGDSRQRANALFRGAHPSIDGPRADRLKSSAAERRGVGGRESGGRMPRRWHRCGGAPPGGEPSRYSHPDWPLRECPECSLVYLEYTPAYVRLEEEFGFTQQYEKQWERRLKEQPILARLDKWTMWRLGMFGDPTP